MGINEIGIRKVKTNEVNTIEASNFEELLIIAIISYMFENYKDEDLFKGIEKFSWRGSSNGDIVFVNKDEQLTLVEVKNNMSNGYISDMKFAGVLKQIDNEFFSADEETHKKIVSKGLFEDLANDALNDVITYETTFLNKIEYAFTNKNGIKDILDYFYLNKSSDTNLDYFKDGKKTTKITDVQFKKIIDFMSKFKELTTSAIKEFENTFDETNYKNQNFIKLMNEKTAWITKELILSYNKNDYNARAEELEKIIKSKVNDEEAANTLKNDLDLYTVFNIKQQLNYISSQRLLKKHIDEIHIPSHIKVRIKNYWSEFKSIIKEIEKW